jgi:hypothetical protein
MGFTPVSRAACEGHTETVRALVTECGADVSGADAAGMPNTPLFWALQLERTATAWALVACGADVDAADALGRTPVWLAAWGGHTACVRALAARGADASAADHAGRTPLDVAAENGHAACARALVEGGADPGPTLRAAARDDAPDVIWLLVRECGAILPARATWLRLAPPGSRAAGLLAALEAWQAPGHAVHAVWNAARRAASFACSVCREETHGDGVAFVACGHRVCPGCWADMRARGVRRCPECRAPIAHGAPQAALPAQQKLFARFCVEAAA